VVTDRIDLLFRRLRARGYFEIFPGGDHVVGAHEPDCAEDCPMTHYTPVDLVGIRWAPTGQAGGRGPLRFNPFCTRVVLCPSLAEALEEMVRLTAPPARDLDYLIY
jgi:hypothetical protein